MFLYLGCWSLSYDGTDNHYTIANCTECLCIADVDHCSNEEFLGRNCGKCVTDERMIGDGRYDCVHGVDEASDAVILKEDGFANWRRILNGATWMCRDPNQSEVVKRCGAVLSNKRRPFLHSFINEERSHEACESVESANGDIKFDFWLCPAGQCVRDKNHCEGQCPWGFEYDRYLGNCKQLECLDHQRMCDNSCIVETRSCHGSCPDGKYFCHEDGWCRDPQEPCGQNNTCPDTDNFHYCPEAGTCQLNNLTCGRTCLGPDRMLCHTTGTCLHLGDPTCSEWCPGRQRLCGDRCIKLTEPCEGTCSVGYWHCLEFSSLCIPRYKQCGGRCYELDEPCLDQIGRTVCFPRGTCPIPIPSSSTTTTTTSIPSSSTTTTTTTTTPSTRTTNVDDKSLVPQSSVSECDEQLCLPDDCDSQPSSPCLGICIGLNKTCHGLCLPGRKLCRDVCIPKVRSHGAIAQTNKSLFSTFIFLWLLALRLWALSINVLILCWLLVVGTVVDVGVTVKRWRSNNVNKSEWAAGPSKCLVTSLFNYEPC